MPDLLAIHQDRTTHWAHLASQRSVLIRREHLITGRFVGEPLDDMREPEIFSVGGLYEIEEAPCQTPGYSGSPGRQAIVVTGHEIDGFDYLGNHILSGARGRPTGAYPYVDRDN